MHVSTVSRTFSAPHLVNPETRSRVLACAEELGYRPNRAARALITGRTHNIGLIVADIANPFFPPLIKAAESQARQRDYHVFVADTNEDPAVEEELVQALAKQVDGVLLCSPRMSNSLIEQLSREVPLVVVNRQVDRPAGRGHGRRPRAPGSRSSTWSASATAARPARRAARLLDQPGDPPVRHAPPPAPADADLTVLGPNPPTEDGGARRGRAGAPQPAPPPCSPTTT